MRKQKLDEYLKDGLGSIDCTISDQELERLFVKCTRDFLTYELSFDDYSSLCEKMLIMLQNKGGHQVDLYSLLHYGAELSWYIRNNPSRAASFLERILDHVNNSRQIC